MSEEPPKKKRVQRTLRQNRAMHKFFKMLADELNQGGLDQRKVLKPSVSIPWTQIAVKKQLWSPIQEALYDTKSTTELAKSEEVSHVHEVLMRHLGEKFGVEHIEFPHFKEGEYEKHTASIK